MKFLDYFFTFIGGGTVFTALLLTVMSFLGKFSYQCITLKPLGELMCTIVFR